MNNVDKDIDLIAQGTVQSQYHDDFGFQDLNQAEPAEDTLGPANEAPIITSVDLGVRPRVTVKRVCSKCTNKLADLNGSNLCFSCQSKDRHRVLREMDDKRPGQTQRMVRETVRANKFGVR